MEVLLESLSMVVNGRVQAGQETFEDLVRQYGGVIYRMAYRLAGNEADAEDLAQQAIIEAFRAFNRFQPGSRFDRWVFRIMTHTFIDGMRRRRRHPLTSLQDPNLDEPLDQSPLPEDVAVQKERSAAVHRALAALPPEYRLAVVLIDLEDLSYEEASEVMRCPLGTVRSRLHRARVMLRGQLKHHLDEA